MKLSFRSSKGVTLIELLIALVVSAVLIAGIYRTVIQQQRTFTAQEQVTDMQQNVRAAMNQIIREIRMGGFGGKNENTNGKNDIIETFGKNGNNINGFTNIITPVNGGGGNGDQMTVIAAYDRMGVLARDEKAGNSPIKVTLESGKTFDNTKKRYLCIGGKDNYEITKVTGNDQQLKVALKEDQAAQTPVFLVKAITYRLGTVNGTPVLFRNENLGEGDQVMAENIEDLQFRYVLADGTTVDAPGDPTQIRGVMISLTARTAIQDPQVKAGGGFRRRTLTSYADLRNLRDDPT